MTDVTTNPGDGEAMPEVVDALTSENETLNPNEDNQDIEDGLEGEEGEIAAALEEVEFEGQTYQVPKPIKDSLLRQADYTRKTQEVAEVRRQVEAARASVTQASQRQMVLAQDIAQLGALNDRLAPFQTVQDWPTYIRQGGAAAQADYAEFQALTSQRNAFAQQLGQKVQQIQHLEQQETAKQIEAGRAELAKHIQGYSPETLSKLETFAAPFGFSPDEIREAEADPRSIRILHLAYLGQQSLTAQQRTQQLALGQQTQPVPTLRGGVAGAKSPDRMGPAEMAKHLGY
jgi:hypothetical protein